MKKSVLIVFLFVLSIQLNAQEFFNYNNLCFAKMDSVQLFSAWSRPRALDFNKDGKIDFAVIDKNNDSLQVFFNNGTAKFTSIPPLVIYIGNSSKDLCVGDFDGDTYTDIATINAQGDLAVFKNLSGTGIMFINSYTNTTNPNLEVELIECGDLNNDSKPDIIGTGKDFSTLLIQAFTFENALSFNFGPINVFPVLIGHTISNNTPHSPVAIADFTGDGFNDFVVGTDDMTDTLEIYPSLGSTIISFSSPTVYKEPLGTFVESITAKDYDGDSKPDIAIAASGGFSINKNAGALNFSNLYSNTIAYGKRFEIKDVDADTYPDLVIADWGGTFNVFRGTNTKGYPFGMYTTFYVGESYRFLLEEFDGNGIPDFVFVGSGDYPYLINCRNFSFHLDNIIVSTNTVICGSTPVNFLATNSHSTYPGTYSWTPGPGTGFNYTATSAGAVSCAFSFTLPPGYGQCVLLTDTIIVNTQVIPTAIISASISAVNCAGTPVGISASVVPVASTYTWSTGSSSLSIIVSPTTTTTYSLFMDDGCQNTATYTVNVMPNPTVSISSPTTTICNGDSVKLTANGAMIYTWYPSSSTTTTLNVKPAATSVYTLVGSDSFGCTDTTNTTITVNLAPSISVVPSKSPICFPDTVTLLASGASTYTWNTGANSSSVTVLVFSNTNYTVVGNNGCKAAKIFSLTGLPRPIITAVASKTAVCNGDSIGITAFGGASYTWIPTFVTGNFFFEYPSTSKTYTVIGLGTNGCYNYALAPVTVFNNPGVTIAANSSEICIGKPVSVVASGAQTYSWTTGPGLNNSSFQVIPQNTSPLIYSVDGTDADGCKSSATQTFVVSDKCNLVVYNGVTPNGDGNNDFFRIDNIEQYPGNLVMIFNRWGQKLSEITDYNNSNNFWSGTSIGDRTVPSGTYYYVIDLKNGSELLKGYIELTKRDIN